MRGPLTFAMSSSGSRAVAAFPVSLALFACGAGAPGPEVDSVEPRAADVAQLPVLVTIRGAHFLGARVSLDDTAPAGVHHGEPRIGGEPLMSVSLVGSDTLTGFVPATLPVGVHDVEVRLETGERGMLAGGFTVLGAGVVPPGVATVPPTSNGCNGGEVGVPERVWPDSTYNERGPALSNDRLSIVFSRANGIEEDIYWATRPSVDAPFGPPHLFDEFGSGRKTTPILSADQRTIYFASDRSGSWDIWKANRMEVGQVFGGVQPLTVVNSTANELRPWLSVDQLTLYFESDRMGTIDVWRATRSDLGSDFATPELVTGLNTTSNEGSASLTPDQLTCYYVADSPLIAGWKTLLRTRRVSTSDSFDGGVTFAALESFNVNGYASLSSDGRELVFGAGGATLQIWRVRFDCSE